jgi:hypothetical protein
MKLGAAAAVHRGGNKQGHNKEQGHITAGQGGADVPRKPLSDDEAAVKLQAAIRGRKGRKDTAKRFGKELTGKLKHVTSEVNRGEFADWQPTDASSSANKPVPAALAAKPPLDAPRPAVPPVGFFTPAAKQETTARERLELVELQQTQLTLLQEIADSQQKLEKYGLGRPLNIPSYQDLIDLDSMDVGVEGLPWEVKRSPRLEHPGPLSGSHPHILGLPIANANEQSAKKIR